MQKLIEAGILIGNDVKDEVGKLKDDHVNFILGLKEKPLVLDVNVMKAVISPEINFIKRTRQVSDKKSVADLVNVYNNKYSVLQKELLRKNELQNAGSIKSLENGGTIIGMIRDGEIEDQTGSIGFETKEKVFNGEVIGAIGRKENGKFVAERIFYPGVHMKSAVKASQPSVVLFARDSKDVSGVNYAILTEPAELPERIATLVMNDFAEFDISGVSFVVSGGAFARAKEKLGLEGKKVAKEMLNRRHVFDDHFIGIVPDFLVLKTDESFVENYKGTTVVGIGEKPVVIDLQTREIESKTI